MNFSIEFVPGTWDGDDFIEPKVIVKALTGTFEEAKPAIEALLADMGLSGIRLEVETPIESHQGDHAHLHQEVHGHA